MAIDYSSYEKYFSNLIEGGYMADDGTPLKCICDCTDFKMADIYKEEVGIVEYSLKCRQCGTTVGHWAYGYWML